MRFADVFATAVRRCRARLLESLLIVLGIALGVAVAAAFAGLIGTVGARNRAFAESLEAREIIIQSKSDRTDVSFSADVPAVAVTRTDGPPYSLTLNDVERIKSRTSPDVKVYAYEDFFTQIALKGDAPTGIAQGSSIPASPAHGETRTVSRLVHVVAATEDMFLAYGAEFREGIGFSGSDVASGNRCIVLGSKLAARLFGDEPALGKKLVWQDEWRQGPSGELEPSPTGQVYTVIGVMAPVKSPLLTEARENPEEEDTRSPDYSADGRAYVPITSAPGMDGPNPHVNEIHAASLSYRGAAQALDQIRQVVEAECHGRLHVSSVMDYMKESMQELRSLATGILVLASAGLVIASINVLNLMLARVLRRTRAIGISAALGAGRRDVFRENLAEALVLGICGGVLGLPLSFGLARLMSHITQGLTVSVGLTGILAGAASCIAASVLFGLYPAYLAARVVPADALRGD
ncbi:MAG: ABC transporter permease [Clostridia bacterium]|nr:ABC transporter permease [Clostridia bacterium]